MRPAAAAAALLLPLLALAEPGAPRFRDGPEAGARAGLALGVGSAAPDVPLDDAVAFQVPFQLEAGLRRGPLAAGLLGAWGPAAPPPCDATVRGARASCSATAARLGAQVTWHATAPGAGAAPWAGGGIAWERTTWVRRRAGVEDATSFRGWLLEAQGGVEWAVARRLALGPFLLAGVGRYGEVRVETAGASATAPLAERSVHGWIHAGVRARVELGGPW